ncbi:MAG: restriction endonuclease subunit S [Bacteroidales bacterium]|nr:restriction endonuclease subunit S [Bacteroidales bacterium]
MKVTKLVGLTIDKAFIPSVANVIGTDLSNYKVIRSEQFACSLMQVSRDGKMPIAMFEGNEAIMSPAYPMFEIIDKTKLLPQYLMMWFSRSEFDREASYYAVGGVRGSLTWDDFCNMRLPVPPIARQHEIVAEYATLTNRIRLNEQMIAKLEETAQALYRKMFVEGIDKENLPEGWRMGTLGEVCEIKYGKAHEGIPNGLIPIYGSGGIMRHGNKSICTEESVLIPRKGSLNNIMYINEPFWTVDTMFYTEMKQPHLAKYVFFNLKQYDFIAMDAGSAVPSMTTNILNQIVIIIPTPEVLKNFDEEMSVIFNNTEIMNKETSKLKDLLSLLLGKMGK